MNKSPCIYLVDNDLSVRKGITRLLTAAGYNVLAYPSVKLFLASLEPGIKGCLILDVRLSFLALEAFIKELSTYDIDLKIIAISADDIIDIRKKGEMVYAKEFFQKPVDGNVLIESINNIINN